MTVEFPQHVPSPYYEVDGDCLVVGGRRLSELAAERPDRQILTIEDPVERRLAGVAQGEVKPHLGLGFAEALRSALR